MVLLIRVILPGNAQDTANITVEKTLGIHSAAYMPVIGTTLSTNPNLDLSVTVKNKSQWSLSIIKRFDVVDQRSRGNMIMAMLSKSFTLKRWKATTGVNFIDWQTYKVLDYQQAIYQPVCMLQYTTAKQTISLQYTYFAIIKPEMDGYLIEGTYTRKWKVLHAELHTWYNSGTFRSDPGVNAGIRLKPTAKISLGKIKGSIVFDGALNITNHLDSKAKASAKDALVIRTYWTW